ncbi:MAG: ATP-grasp domain-containing protein [Gammaproteobacteria bacterium]|nr:ATP-grasp domain-containing protein [Gammaproteobacteria bacterium]
MIRSLLVANRGEIACRIFRTARRHGVRTIAVFSTADAHARHVREADAAFALGPAPARESYLDPERLLAAARVSGAQAIHPGYGFLSENAEFAAACERAGLIFVGPPAAAIAAMGSKILAKARMQEAGVPVLPGYAGERQDLPHLEAEGRRAGFPLIVKPAAGGGGKGMQIVREATQLPAALAAARRLAESAFGDGALLLERYLTAPRHIEVQVFADRHGHFLHLGERDCSTQRRHQKLIEEAPAPELPETLRERLRSAALVVARAIDYVGAGTVEFLYDGRDFFFMEMNTRLQVEHTVTEAITGLDLVEWQLRVAAGEPLPLTQEQVRFSGHAIEARVCAEDPARGFLPSAGRLQRLQWPQAEQVRVDAGFGSGDTVPDNYDSLLGKVIAWGGTRAEAAERLAAALERTECAGVRSNEHWLARWLRGTEFREVRHHIASLDAAAGAPEPVPEEGWLLAALCLAGSEAGEGCDPWERADAFIPNLPGLVRYDFEAPGSAVSVLLHYSGGTLRSGQVEGGAAWPLAILARGADHLRAQLGERQIAADFCRSGPRLWLWWDGHALDTTLDDPRTHAFSASAAQGGLTTPLPGVVVSVPVKLGERVAAGTVLVVIEAMKMEHTLTAPYAGTVSAIHFAPGSKVPEGSALLELTPEGG